MEILLVRHTSTRWGIDGHLYINRKRVCDTVEHQRFHLPAGVYEVTLSFPFRHGDGALASRHGEIIVGKTALPGLVTQSQATYDRLYERIKKAWQRHTTIHLTIRG